MRGLRRMHPWMAALSALAVACSGGPEDAPPDVILVTVDTLRADHLGAYGAVASRTPVMDALADEGTLFENATSPMPETRPTHFTLFTSQYPRDHGVVSNMAFPRPGLVALPSLYRADGYRTAAFVGCGLFDDRARASLGFELLDAPPTPQRSAEQVVPRVVSWLEEQDGERPLFVWVHLFDPHMPYEPPGSDEDEPLADSWPSFAWPRLLRVAEENQGDLPRPVLDRARTLYRREVEHVDHWLGRLLESQRQRGRWERTLVLLAADHGECFSGGVFFDHSPCVGEGALAVPLILRLPGHVAAGRRVARQVELLDVAPTLLRLSGLAVPEAFQGEGLLARAAPPGEGESLAFFEQPHYRPVDVRNRNEVLSRLRSVGGEPTRLIDPDRRTLGVRSGDWKYVLGATGERLVHLAEDPGEARNVADEEPERLKRLRLVLQAWQGKHPVPSQVLDLDPEQVENLRSLGYFWP